MLVEIGISLLGKVSCIRDNVKIFCIADKSGVEIMKRNYKYEKEMLHWLDGGDIEMRYCYEPWEPFDGFWAESDGWEYRIVRPAEKPKEERWLYVNKIVWRDITNEIATEPTGLTTLTTAPTTDTIGKIRMEDV
jgi:hypothetical protein